MNESQLRNLMEDVLGDNWHENDSVKNNYEPFEGEEPLEPQGEHNQAITGEREDPTVYGTDVAL